MIQIHFVRMIYFSMNEYQHIISTTQQNNTMYTKQQQQIISLFAVQSLLMSYLMDSLRFFTEKEGVKTQKLRGCTKTTLDVCNEKYVITILLKWL
jgi:hypothetical protein